MPLPRPLLGGNGGGPKPFATIEVAHKPKPWLKWLPFPAFKHFILLDGEVKEVARSHWIGGFENGKFSIDHGRTSEQLGEMFMLLAERISRKPNFIGYSFRDEMICGAMLQLCDNGLQFNEVRSDNPFAFLTTVVINSFIRTINTEAKGFTICDDLLEMAGAPPSNTRLIDHELRHMHVPEPVKRKPGRKLSSIQSKS